MSAVASKGAHPAVRVLTVDTSPSLPCIQHLSFGVVDNITNATAPHVQQILTPT